MVRAMNIDTIVRELILDSLDTKGFKQKIEKAIEEYDVSKKVVEALDEYFESEDFKALIQVTFDEEFSENNLVFDLARNLIKQLDTELKNRVKVTLK